MPDEKTPGASLVQACPPVVIGLALIASERLATQIFITIVLWTVASVLSSASSLRSGRFLDRSHPASDRTPSAAHCPDQLPPRCDE